MPHPELVADAALAPAPGGFLLRPEEHEQYRTLSRHGNPYLVTDRRVLGFVGRDQAADAMALRDVGYMHVQKGLLHQDSYWTVRFRSTVPGAPEDPRMFFKTRSGAEEMVREVQRALRSAAAGPPAPELSRP